jgi:hypothetical protein
MVRLYSLILSREEGAVKSFMRQLDIRMELKNQAGGEGHENLIHLRDLKNSYSVMLEQKGEPYDSEYIGQRDETWDRVKDDGGWVVRQEADVPRNPGDGPGR